MKTYQIKTRNFHCNKIVFKLLSLSHRWGTQRGDSYNDGDGKFILATSNPLKAWATWLYFMALRRLSGGWTYIIRPGRTISGREAKAIY